MTEVIDKPDSKFNLKEFLQGVDERASIENTTTEKSRSVGEKSAFMQAVLDMPTKGKQHNAETMQYVANNLERLMMLLTMKQMLGGNSKVFEDDKAYEAVMTSLTLGSLIVGTFASSIEKMSDDQFEKMKAAITPKSPQA